MAEKTQLIPPHQWTDDSGRVLLVKCVGPGGETHGGFRWPLEAGVEVVAPDWEPKAECGNGLHGWPWGLAVGDGKGPDYGATWIVFAADPADVVDLGGKAKCRAAMIVTAGTYLECILRIQKGQIAWTQQAARSSGAASNSGDRGAASNSGISGAASNSGDSGAASNSGDSGAASNSGYSGAASNSGYRGAASNSGYSGAASNSGDRGAASNSGISGAASNSGDSGAASNSGDRGAASNSGYRGAASNSGISGAASNSGYSGAASNSGISGAASNSGYRGAASNSGISGAASNSGYRGAVANTGEWATIDLSGKHGLAAVTSDTFLWVIRPGAVVAQRTERGVWLLFAEEYDVPPGTVLLVEHGVAWVDWR